MLKIHCLLSRLQKKQTRDEIFQLKHNNAPGPDGFPADFYQFFWDVIKSNLMELFIDFHKGNLPLYSLNFRGIYVITKRKAEATMI